MDLVEHRAGGVDRIVVALTVALAAGLVALLSGVLWAARSAPAPAAAGRSGHGTAASGTPQVPAAVEVLRSWDDRRAHAWATGDVAGLRRLYTPASRAGRTDATMLTAYVRRGLRVDGLRQQLLGVRVLSSAPDRLRLAVTDRLAGATAVGAGLSRPLPTGVARREVVVLVRRTGAWRVSGVRAD